MEQRGYGDFLAHDERYARANEFLTVCNALWEGDESPVSFSGQYYQVEGSRISTPFTAESRSAPEIYVSGHSAAARELAARRASCWLRVIDTPAAVAQSVFAARAQGLEVCLRLGIVCRATHAEAVSVVEELRLDPVVNKPVGAVKDDSQMYREPATDDRTNWLSPCIWAGLSEVRGPVWITLLGTPEELAQALIEYKQLGVTQFIMSGWPEMYELEIFGREVLPLIRRAEAVLES